MSQQTIFPPLTEWEPTRRTLQRYSRVVGAVPRAHAEAHPQWWHISLKVTPDGLTTDKMALPDDPGEFWLLMDLCRHLIVLSSDAGVQREFDMTAGLSATEMGELILGAVAELGMSGDYVREKFADDEPGHYEPEAAARYLGVLTEVDQIFKAHRATLDGEPGPVQLWPHGFDLAFEWFGTRTIEHEEEGEMQALPSQLNLGFYPGDAENPAYFYANPWPFARDVLLSQPLPAGAYWYTDSWEGSVLPYAELVDDPDGPARLADYARRVYVIAKPTL